MQSAVQVLLAALLAPVSVLAAAPELLEGDWSGALATEGGDLRLVLRVRGEAGALVGSVDSPDQGATGIPVAGLSYGSGRLIFDVPAVQGRYEGSWDDARKLFAGRWSQPGAGTLPLDLSAGGGEALRRPQLPVAPFPYRIEETSFPGAAASLAGTLTRPDGPGPFRAAVLVAGSGPNDRDETIAGHKPFAVIADALTRRGIAVLRYDKRGVGTSKGDYRSATTRDFADDAAAAVAYLRTRRDILPDSVGLIGHSEGGLVGPLVAGRDSRLSFLVLMAGPAIRGDALLLAQSRALNVASGRSPSEIARADTANREVYRLIETESDDARLREQLDRVLADLGLPASAREAQIRALISPWFRAFLMFDPAPFLKALRLPVLVLNGDKDLQVPVDANIPAMRAVMAGNPDAEIVVLPGLNHLFQTAGSGLPAEYGRLAETIEPDVLLRLGDFVTRPARR